MNPNQNIFYSLAQFAYVLPEVVHLCPDPSSL